MIVLVPIGNIDEAALEALRQPLEEVFHQRTTTGDRVSLSPENYYHSRRQYLAPPLLSLIPLPKPVNRALGVVDVDTFAPGLNFVFGVADTAGGRALVSLPRLRQEFYSLLQNENLFRERVLKEAVHELGHTYGLGHCPNLACVMHFSNSLEANARLQEQHCDLCGNKLPDKAYESGYSYEINSQSCSRSV